MSNDKPKTIEEMIHTRKKLPTATLAWAKDVSRRIKKLEETR